MSDVMLGDPKECRAHAVRCAELAVTAQTPQLKAAFLGLSKNWEKLAIELEDAFAKLMESEDIERFFPADPTIRSPFVTV